jgi:23S rRNA G2445 N2-methylase RlmL
MPTPARHTFFATCAPGLEPILHAEARGLELAKLERQVGGVRFEGRLQDAWRANLWLRTAVRVLLRLSRFEAADANALYAGVQHIDWREWIAPGATIAISAQTKESALDHSQFVEQRVKDAIVDQLRAATGRASVGRQGRARRPRARAHLAASVARSRSTLQASRCTSAAGAGSRDARRWPRRSRQASCSSRAGIGARPWSIRFCGSGTLLIERRAVGGQRRAGLVPRALRLREAARPRDAARWQALREEARGQAVVPKKLALLGLERDAATAKSALENVQAAGLAGRIAIEEGAAESWDYKPGWNAWLVTNPPYGERVGDERALESLYKRFGNRLAERCGGWHLALLSGNPRLARALGLPVQQRTALKNGSIDCELLALEIPRGVPN